MVYDQQYYDPSHEAGYAGAQNLIRVNINAKSLKKNTATEEKKRIHQWLSNQDAYTLHRPVKRRFPRLHYNVNRVDDLWECDLMQLTTLKEYNDGYSYLLVVIDVLSKYAWVEPIRVKTAHSTSTAFEKILERADNRTPFCLQSDQGKEFINSEFQSLLKKYDIKFRVATNPDIKAAIVERLNRTIRERMWRYFSHQNTKRYIDIIQNIVYAYNHTLHSGTKMKPVDVNNTNANKAYNNLKNRALSQTVNRRNLKKDNKYSVGDYVRVSRTKQTFEKGYEKNFSEEIFKIKRVSFRQNLYIYILEDLNGEIINGFFYPEELSVVGKERMNSEQVFKIERVIRTKGRGSKKQAFVKWLGYPDKFNSWISATDLKNI